MKKTVYAFALALGAVLGFNISNAAAQEDVSATVGNVGSDNVAIVEQGYEVVAPVVSDQAPASAETPNVSAPSAAEDNAGNMENIMVTEEAVEVQSN